MKQNGSVPFIPGLTLKDFVASIAVFLVAIPLCLGIAHASGVPLLSGLMAGVVGGILVGVMSQSPLSVTGPAAGLVAIVIAGISELGSYQAFLVATLLAGLLQVLFGVFKLGRFSQLFPNAVIQGMLAGIGVIIVMKQYKVWLGADSTTSYQALAVGLGTLSLVLMFVWEKYFGARFKLVPSSLVAVIACVLFNALAMQFSPQLSLTGSSYASIPVIGGLADLYNLLPRPDWSALSGYLVYKHAFIIAIVASLESLLCLNGIEAIDPEKRPAAGKERELIAQGAGNMLSGFLGSLPVTSVIVRSTVNLNAGASGKGSAVLHGVWILLALFVGAALLSQIPLVALASILIFTGYKLAHPSRFKSFFDQGLNQFLPFVTTVIVCVMQDLLFGILAGVICHLVIQRIQNIYPSNLKPKEK